MRRRFNLNITAAGGFNPGSPLFFDDFDYTVTNSPANAAANSAAFAAAGWTRVKALNCVINSGAGGNLYTVDVGAIPGHSGVAPGSTQRALCINSLAGTTGVQTDFFVQLGNGTNGDIPANVWFQWWSYVCRSGAQQSQFHAREKWLYPSRKIANGTAPGYPADPSTGLMWLWEVGAQMIGPDVSVSNPGEALSFINDSGDATQRPNWTGASDTANAWKLGQNLNSTMRWLPNQWVQTKLHFDTSGPNGVFEQWMRYAGSQWVKTSEWIGGTTPGLTWNVLSQYRDGHGYLLMPSTLPGPNAPGQYNLWLYMQDFAMASSEAALPTYG